MGDRAHAWPEVHLEGVQQIQVKVLREYPERSITFARALRAASMQNPDVIAISQLRDAETTDTALQAALSGALVLSRLHAPGAAPAVARLAALGAAPHLLADCLRAVVAQALLRRNCPDCVKPAPIPDHLPLGPEDRADLTAHARAGSGCARCHGTGLRGVLPVFEFLAVHGELARAIATGANATALQEIARRDGEEPLAAAARRHVLSGEVPVGEYLKLF
jgi:type II secretory ATPase GspE/PulE/Tfp pilus assembly ATPase PilB-like protein